MTDADWSLARRLAFRLVFLYWTLFLVPYVGAFVAGRLVERTIGLVMASLTAFVAEHLLRLPAGAAAQHPTGSGDTLFDFVQVLTVLLLAGVGTVVWSIVDRRRRTYATLASWLQVMLRYSLGLVLLSYGLAKLFPGQFPPPQLDRYLEPFGTSSPMGLLWTMMQSSATYTFFTGLIECTAGVLLFWQRTATIGALLAATAMTNVVMLNFTYDVPVKLYSVHLLAMSVFVLWPDLRRLADALVVARPVTRRPRLIWVAKYAVVIAILGLTIAQWRSLSARSRAERPPLYGIYEVETFTRDGQVAPPLLTDARRWRHLVFNNFGSVSIHRMDEGIDRYGTKLEPATHTLTLIGGPDPKRPAAIPLTYERSETSLKLSGTFEGALVDVTLKRFGDERQFLLVNRGFHWIQEYPFNR